MTDNVVEFDKIKASKDAKEEVPTADDYLKMAIGKYGNVVIIGTDGERVEVSSNVDAPEALFTLARAVHKLNTFLDRA